jgi:hypothetical protein
MFIFYRIEKYINSRIFTHNMYIRNKKIGKWNYYVLEDRVKKGEKYLTVNIRYLGTAKKLLEDLKELDRYRRKKP